MATVLEKKKMGPTRAAVLSWADYNDEAGQHSTPVDDLFVGNITFQTKTSYSPSRHLLELKAAQFIERMANSLNADELLVVQTSLNNLIKELSSFIIESLHISKVEDSIFLRFQICDSAGMSFEFKLQVYYDYNPKDQDDIEAILHINKGDQRLQPSYGSIDEMIALIYQHLKFHVDYALPGKISPNFYIY